MTDFGTLFTRLTEPYPLEAGFSVDHEEVARAMKAFRGQNPQKTPWEAEVAGMGALARKMGERVGDSERFATAEREATVKFLRSWADSAKDQIVYAIRHDTNEDLLELAHEAYTVEILADSIETGEHLHE